MSKMPCSARVLVIDNDPRVGRDLQMMLEPLGYHVCVAPGAGRDLQQHAQDLARSFRPHVAIVDLRLIDEHIEDLSGLTLLDSLRSARCILYSAYLKPEVTRKARYRADSWVSKRESPQQLLDAVADAAHKVCAAHKDLTIRTPSNWTSQHIIETLFDPDQHVPYETVTDLLSQLFSRSEVVTLETLEGTTPTPASVSRGRSVVLKAWRNNKKEPLVVKLAPAHRIKAEGQNYSEHIDDNLRGLFHARLEADPVIFWDLGGVLYSFVGVSSERLPSFAAFYQRESDPQTILRPLEHLFSKVWNDLYADTARLDETLFDAYSASLRLQRRLSGFTNDQETLSFPGVPVALRNPVHWVSRHKGDSALPNTRQAVTHGDLHGDNLFVDRDHAWAIDFERSGPGPILRDFVELEVDIVTRLVSFAEDDLYGFYRLTTVLAGNSDPDALLQQAKQMTKTPEIHKALAVISGLRKLAYDVTRYSDFREYLWGLLFDALFVASLALEKSSQRDRAILLGAIVCERLRRWDKEWPPAEWPMDSSSATVRTDLHVPGLRQTLEIRFNESELRTLCGELQVDYDALPGNGYADKPRELIAYLERRSRLLDLFRVGQRLRPDIHWPELHALYEAQHNSAPQP